VSETSSIIHRDFASLRRRSLRGAPFTERYEDHASNDAARTSPVQGLPR
jgi:hypothetical protein